MHLPCSCGVSICLLAWTFLAYTQCHASARPDFSPERRSESEAGDDLPGLLHNWGVGLHTWALICQVGTPQKLPVCQPAPDAPGTFSAFNLHICQSCGLSPCLGSLCALLTMSRGAGPLQGAGAVAGSCAAAAGLADLPPRGHGPHGGPGGGTAGCCRPALGPAQVSQACCKCLLRVQLSRQASKQCVTCCGQGPMAQAWHGLVSTCLTARLPTYGTLHLDDLAGPGVMTCDVQARRRSAAVRGTARCQPRRSCCVARAGGAAGLPSSPGCGQGLHGRLAGHCGVPAHAWAHGRWGPLGVLQQEILPSPPSSLLPSSLFLLLLSSPPIDLNEVSARTALRQTLSLPAITCG